MKSKPAQVYSLRSMSWRLLRGLAICLLLGVIINVLVAVIGVRFHRATFVPEYVRWENGRKPNHPFIPTPHWITVTDPCSNIESPLWDRTMWVLQYPEPATVTVRSVGKPAPTSQIRDAWSHSIDESWLDMVDSSGAPFDTSAVLEHEWCVMLVARVQSGWPFRAFTGYRVVSYRTIPAEFQRASFGAHDAILLAQPVVMPDDDYAFGSIASSEFNEFHHRDRADILPLRPIARGFVINSALYAIAPLLIYLPAWSLALRRTIRAHYRRQCPTCAYSTVGLAPGACCPECGGELPESSRRALGAAPENGR